MADGRVVLQDARELGETPPVDAVFLGRIENGRHVWAVRGALQAPDGADVSVLDIRATGDVFDDVSAQLVSSAIALLNWHDNARFSAVDGTPTKPVRGGWARANPLTGVEEFPRIDPAVICLVHDGADRVVLARQHNWPVRMFSLLAGFVEAGESFEACVVREVHEEVGLSVRDVTYLGSQPWPFPRSLMVGFHAVADPGQTFAFSDGEITEANWFTRDEVRAALSAAPGTTATRMRNCCCPDRSRSPGPSSSPGPSATEPAVYPPRRSSFAFTSRPVGFVSVEPSANRSVGTVRLPPLAELTNSAAVGSCSISISV